MPFPSQIKRLWSKAGPLGLSLPAEDLSKPRLRRTTTAIWVAIFVVAVGVRLFQWQDNRPTFPRIFAGMVEHNKTNARLLLKGDLAGFIKGPAPPGDANVLTYPPGYPIIMATVFRLFGDSDTSMRVFQIVCDAATAVLLFFLALELLPRKAAVIAGALAALSPQLAYYSLLLIPDSLVTLPILLALYFLVRALKRNRMRAVVAAGVFIGLSCWLRSNALLLAPFLALLLFLIMERGRRWRYAGALVGATLLVIAPITIRNLVVFHHFIPLSLGAGQMLNVGITDYDKEQRFGLPGTDLETVTREAEAHGRPDYASSLFGGDGVGRDRERTARAMTVVRAHPFWFAGVVLRRAVSMLKFERVHIVSLQPAVTHALKISPEVKPSWSLEPSDFMAHAASAPRVSPAANGNAVRLEGHEFDSENETLITSFVVERNTDYLVRLPLTVEQGSVVLTIISPDQEEVYAATPVLHVLETLPGVRQQTYIVQIPFVSKEDGSAQLRIANENRKPGPMAVEMGEIELFRLGPASLLWTKYPRAIIRLVQKFFVTAWMVPLALLGAILIYAAGGGRLLAALLAIPLYYLSAQSFLHTEYRYVMAIQPSLFILVAATLYWSTRTVVDIRSRMFARKDALR